MSSFLSGHPPRENDRRFWILDPEGHRVEERLRAQGLVDRIPPGWAVIDATSSMDVREWICDLCNETILSKWGREPFPVPMFGSYALCADHFYEVQGWAVEDDYGEPIAGSTLGSWPSLMCNCRACLRAATEWNAQLRFAYYGKGVVYPYLN